MENDKIIVNKNGRHYAFVDGKCPKCNGTGFLDGKELDDTPECNERELCPECDGTGSVGFFQEVPDMPRNGDVAFGDLIRKARIQRKCGFSELAKLLNCNVSHVSEIELGIIMPTDEERKLLEAWLKPCGKDPFWHDLADLEALAKEAEGSLWCTQVGYHGFDIMADDFCVAQVDGENNACYLIAVSPGRILDLIKKFKGRIAFLEHKLVETDIQLANERKSNNRTCPQCWKERAAEAVCGKSGS